MRGITCSKGAGLTDRDQLQWYTGSSDEHFVADGPLWERRLPLFACLLDVDGDDCIITT